MPTKRPAQHSADHLLAERAARKQKQVARTQVREQAQAQVAAEQVALQALYDQLQTDHNKLLKRNRNKKKAERRKLKKTRSAVSDLVVVHGSNSCEEEDSDVLSKHHFLAGTLAGTSQALDDELAVHLFAQQALESSSSSTNSQNATNMQAVNGTNSARVFTPPSPLPALPFIPPVLPPSPKEPQATSASNTRAVALLPNSLSHLLEEDYDAAPQDASAKATIKRGDELVDAFLEAKLQEEELKANSSMHDERVIRLISSGYHPREAVEALAATKLGGFESTKRALEHLRVKSGTPISAISKAVDDCNQRIDQLTSKTAASVSKTDAVIGPSLSNFINNHPRAEELAGRAQRQHDKSAFGHLTCSSRAAINLKEIIKQSSDAPLRECQWLGAICLAVCEDCAKCGANKAKKRDRDDADRAKLLSSAEKMPGPATVPWASSDVRHDRKLPKLTCFVCDCKPSAERKERNEDEEEDWLQHCENCHRAAHEECERLTEWVDNYGDSTYCCKLCLRQKQAALERDRRGPSRDWTNARYIGGGGSAGAGLSAPSRHAAAAGASGALPHRSAATPPRSPSENNPISPRSSRWDNRQEIEWLLQKLVDNSPNSGTKDSALNTSTGSNGATITPGSSNTNVRINNYIMWEEANAGKSKQGIETGSGVAAWAWFKRTNIPIRDAAVNMKGTLGLLAANAISHNMQITLAASMLNEAEVQPKPNMTEKEIDLWVTGDREFTWLKTLPDAVLIKVMDRLSASVNPAPFFRLVIAAEIPNMKDGDLYYPVTEFNAHADKWISTLSDLIKGGWQEGSTNLKQVFLASICTCQLVYDQAKREMHEDVLRLIATLKKWIVV